MKILIADTYYPEFLKSLPFDPESKYESNLAAVLDAQFGTADFYSRNLRTLGHECIDVIVNHEGLQEMRSFAGELALYNVDVVFLQDLNIDITRRPPLVAGQLSCPWPGDANVRKCDVIFTSFPHYVPRIEALGVRAVYLPLAFEPSVLEGPQPERDIDISFVGGVGRDLHWKQGTDVLEAVAAAFPERFAWYGYGLERLSSTSPLRDCYKGEAWGRKMYDIYRRSKIVINRHGEVAEGYANNMRMYEATGAGALLVTDNQTDLFEIGNEIVGYGSPQEAVENIDQFINRDPRYSLLSDIAAFGQQRTLRDHTYAQRMKTVSEVLTGILVTT